MHRIKLLTALIALPCVVWAQPETDILRWSETELLGTSRYMSMAGSFHALGGDISAIKDNPAATAVFLKSEIAANLGLMTYTNQTNLLNKTSSNSDVVLGFPTLGFVSTRTLGEGNFKNVNFGVSYHRLKNFSSTISLSGDRNNYPLAASLADAAFNTHPDDLVGNVYLAYQGYVINPYQENSSAPIEYSYGVNPDSLEQRFTYDYTGKLNETNFSFGTNYNNQLYFGAAIGFVSGIFEESNVLRESTNTNNTFVKEYTLVNTFSQSTFGVNAKFGVIARIGPAMRFSLSYQTPTTLSNIETFDGYISSDTLGGAPIEAYLSEAGLGGTYEYRIVLPSKLNLGAAVIVGKSGAISASIESRGYTTAKFKPAFGNTDYSFTEDNNEVQEVLKGQSFTASIGGEYRRKFMSYRAGLSLRTSPYQSTYDPGYATMYYTAGLGYRNDGFYLDGAVVIGNQTTNFYPHGGSQPAKVNNSYFSPSITLGFRF